MQLKKVLLLGGAYSQVPSVKKAKELGYYVITCDYCPDNPGHKYADEYYNVSTTDKEAVLELAKKLEVDGVVCYASDPSATTAAYVSEKLGFPTSPYESVEILSNKDKYRKFLEENHFNVPRSRGYSDIEEAKKEISEFNFPIMVKPVDSSGSKGVSKIDSSEDLEVAVENALSYSRCKRFILEEYVEKCGYQGAGDGFVVDGKLVFRCFCNEHFEATGINPYVPIGTSCPCAMPDDILDKIHAETQRMIDLLHLKSAALNFDIRLDSKGDIYIMELGHRNGGNMIPQIMELATGVDTVAYTIKAAMGEDLSDLTMVKPEGFYSSYVIHSPVAGILKEVQMDEEFKKNNLLGIDLFYKPGDEVPAFVGSNGTIGLLVLKYSSKEEMFDKMGRMTDFVKVVLE